MRMSYILSRHTGDGWVIKDDTKPKTSWTSSGFRMGEILWTRSRQILCLASSLKNTRVIETSAKQSNPGRLPFAILQMFITLLLMLILNCLFCTFLSVLHETKVCPARSCPVFHCSLSYCPILYPAPVAQELCSSDHMPIKLQTWN